MNSIKKASLSKGFILFFSGAVALHPLSSEHFEERNHHHDLVCYNRTAICALQGLLRASYRGCVQLVRSILKYWISMDSERYVFRRKCC